MRRAVLAVIAALAPVGAAGAADLNAPIEQRIRNADSVRVVRMREPLSGESGEPGDDRLDDFIVERVGRTDGAWKTGMAEALAGAMRRFAEPEICRRQSGRLLIRFGVQFFTAERRTSFVVYLAERCVEFWSGRAFEGSADMHGLAPPILALLKQALPTDTTVRHLDLTGRISCEDYLREHPAAVLVEHPAEPTRRVPPDYPKEAKKAKIDGEVLVEVMVGADGAVGETRVLQSVPALDAAAVAAARQWRFAPALDCWGRPIASRVVLPVRFALPR